MTTEDRPKTMAELIERMTLQVAKHFDLNDNVSDDLLEGMALSFRWLADCKVFLTEVDPVDLESKIAVLELEVDRWRRLYLDKPEDRLYHASDNTWWRRDDSRGIGRLISADPPPGWTEVDVLPPGFLDDEDD